MKGCLVKLLQMILAIVVECDDTNLNDELGDAVLDRMCTGDTRTG